MLAVTPSGTSEWGVPRIRADRDLRAHIMKGLQALLRNRSRCVIMVAALTRPRGGADGFFSIVTEITEQWDKTVITSAEFATGKQLQYNVQALEESKLWQAFAVKRFDVRSDVRSRAEMHAQTFFANANLLPDGLPTSFDRQTGSTEADAAAQLQIPADDLVKSPELTKLKDSLPSMQARGDFLSVSQAFEETVEPLLKAALQFKEDPRQVDMDAHDAVVASFREQFTANSGVTLAMIMAPKLSSMGIGQEIQQILATHPKQRLFYGLLDAQTSLVEADVDAPGAARLLKAFARTQLPTANAPKPKLDKRMPKDFMKSKAGMQTQRDESLALPKMADGSIAFTAAQLEQVRLAV